MDGTCKSDGAPHEYLGDETPHERLTGNLFNFDSGLASGGVTVTFTSMRSNVAQYRNSTRTLSGGFWQGTLPIHLRDWYGLTER